MAARQLNLVDKSLAVFAKDIRSELRTRYALSAIIMFALVTVIAVGFASGGVGFGTDMQGIILWLVIYFAAVAGLGQSFIKEEESGTALALRIYGNATAIFIGKYLFNLVLLFALEIVIVPLYAFLIGLAVSDLTLFFAILMLSTIGLAGSTTIIAAIISKASIKGILFAVLSFPLLLPLLIIAISGTQKALMPMAVFADGWPEIKILLSYSVVMTTAGMLLFEYVWHD